jgi:16S rRNA (cytidine1402-2'-O)-methyltransferase
VSQDSGAAGGKAGRLSLVATPIGNLEDVTPRAARALAEADCILAEDTRRTRVLLSHLGIARKTVERLDAEVESGSLARWLGRLAAGEALVLVSDAGTPTVSDPGAALVRAAAAEGHAIVPLPGPSAVLAALAASGFSADHFRFFGFLPRRGTARRTELERLRDTEEVVVLFEAPGRIEETLGELASIAPERQVVVAREMTKLHEEFVRGTVAELCEREAGRDWRGELTVVLGPLSRQQTRMGDGEIDQRVAELLGQGMRLRDVARSLALGSGWGAREIYARAAKNEAGGRGKRRPGRGGERP